jgi:hypothetical protein
MQDVHKERPGKNTKEIISQEICIQHGITEKSLAVQQELWPCSWLAGRRSSGDMQAGKNKCLTVALPHTPTLGTTGPAMPSSFVVLNLHPVGF